MLCTPKPLEVLNSDLVLMSCCCVSGENLNVVLTFGERSLTNASDLFGILLLSCSPILPKYLFIESAIASGLVIITSPSTTEVMLVVLDRLLINLFIVAQVSFR